MRVGGIANRDCTNPAAPASLSTKTNPPNCATPDPRVTSSAPTARSSRHVLNRAVRSGPGEGAARPPPRPCPSITFRMGHHSLSKGAGSAGAPARRGTAPPIPWMSHPLWQDVTCWGMRARRLAPRETGSHQVGRASGRPSSAPPAVCKYTPVAAAAGSEGAQAQPARPGWARGGWAWGEFKPLASPARPPGLGRPSSAVRGLGRRIRALMLEALLRYRNYQRHRPKLGASRLGPTRRRGLIFGASSSADPAAEAGGSEVPSARPLAAATRAVTPPSRCDQPCPDRG